MPRAARLPVLLAAIALAACAPAGPDPAPPSSTDEAAASPGESRAAPGESGAAVEVAWTELDDAPLARLEMATAAHDGRIWMVGGLSPLGEAVTEVETFDPATGEWSSGPAVPTGIHHAALAPNQTSAVVSGETGPRQT